MLNNNDINIQYSDTLFILTLNSCMHSVYVTFIRCIKFVSSFYYVELNNVRQSLCSEV